MALTERENVPSYLLLTKIVREVGDHDLVLAGNAVFWWAALLARLCHLALAGLGWIDSDGTFLAHSARQGLVGGCGQTSSLARDVGRTVAVGCTLDELAVCALASLCCVSCCSSSIIRLFTYATTTASTTATSTSTAASRIATLVTLSALSPFGRSGGSRLGLTSELHRNLAVEDGLAVQLIDGTLGLGRCGDIDEGVADRAGGAWVGWDGCGLTVGGSLDQLVAQCMV